MMNNSQERPYASILPVPAGFWEWVPHILGPFSIRGYYQELIEVEGKRR